MTWPAYPSYQHTTAGSLGDIPQHWIPVRLRHHLRVNPPVPEWVRADGRKEVPFLPMEAIGVDWSLDLGRSRPVDELLTGYSYFEDGDVLFAKVTPCFENGKGAHINRIPTGLGFGTSEVTTLRPKPDLEQRFLGYVVQSDRFKQEGVGAMTGAGGLKRVPDDFVRDFWIGLPGVPEQRGIVEFLDRESAKIDALIAKQEQLIATLRENRAATVTLAVTKGLDSQAEMRASGVPWLDSVPSHWSIIALKHILSQPITDGPHETPEFLDDGIEFISAEAVSSGIIDFDRRRGYISYEDHLKYSRKYSPKLHDIFVVKSGATTGVAAIVTDDRVFDIWSPLAVVRCRQTVNPYFVLNFIRSADFQRAISLSWTFGTQQNIGMGTLGSLRVVLPPRLEQDQIVEVLQGRRATIDALIAKAQEVIVRMREYRAALITDAVTGKIDVREAI